MSSDDSANLVVKIPKPIKWAGYALIILFYVALGLFWANRYLAFASFNVTISGVSVSSAQAYWLILISVIAGFVLVGGSLALYAMYFRIRTTMRKAEAANHRQLIVPLVAGYAMVFLGGVALMYLFGVFMPLAMAYPAIQTPPVRLTNQVIIYLGWTLIAIGAIVAYIPVMFVSSAYDPRRTASQIFKSFIDSLLKKD